MASPPRAHEVLEISASTPQNETPPEQSQTGGVSRSPVGDILREGTPGRLARAQGGQSRELGQVRSHCHQGGWLSARSTTLEPKRGRPKETRAGLREPSLMSAIVGKVEGSAKATRGARHRFLYIDICTRPRKFSTTPSHKRSGLRSPALASSMILMAIRRSDAIVAVVSRHHSSVAENRRTKTGFSFANGDCVTHMRQGFPLQRFFAAPSRSICRPGVS
jgi:hypothetical protein